MEKRINCPICDSETRSYPDFVRNTVFYNCPVCGRYELDIFHGMNHNHLAAYLVHNRYTANTFQYRYHTTLDKDICDQYNKEFEQGNNTHGRPVHMNTDIVDNWYPKSFSEKLDYILLYLNKRIEHLGQQVTFSYQELLSAFFIDRKENDANWNPREDESCEMELRYMLNYLVNCSYINYTVGSGEEDWADISLAPQGYMRIDALQKNTANGRKVLVAMKFGDDTKQLREAIRKGVTDAEYIAVFIDEVQHNDFITPELLKHIRDSKFVVVDLTHKNNGAYFEEGYAMGLGKQVIQLCHKDTTLHFDIAQKNTIIWNDEEDIPSRLTNRIKATIE